MRYLLLFSLLLTSCTTLDFVKEDTLKVKISSDKTANRKYRTTGRKEFYFFGLYPSSHKISLDEELTSAGVVYEASNISFGEYRTNNDLLMGILSFGLYTPIHYFVSGHGRLND